ncbi:MAG TPA: substrate-binding domain-containing protein, partial [Candidatus Sulfomarinibacteraceae bacterium]|nr:substrate-binding domain-containing protein [Candidatus Sulfomarinibacteraceae bacterium]
GIDLAIEYQIDEGVGNRLMAKFRQAEIPVIAVDIPMVGASFFGADNYRTGHAAGVALGKWVDDHWDGEVDRMIVLEEPRAGAQPAARIQGQIDGFQEVLGELPEALFKYLDGGNTRHISEERTRAVLAQWPEQHCIAVLCFNDDNALGALDAARSLGREEHVAIVGQGADSSLRPEIRRRNSRIIGSTSFMPEQYGEALVEMALKILRGEPVPPADYIEHVFINADNIDLFYPENE